jgi:predicted ferric reductase
MAPETPRGGGLRTTDRPQRHTGRPGGTRHERGAPPVPTGLSGRLALFAVAYVAIVMLPLAVILLGERAPERGFAIEFAVALGFIGLAMLGLQSILTARHPRLTGAVGQENLLQFHRQAGLIAFTIIAAHPVILLAANPDYWDFLDPRDSAVRALALWIVALALPVLVATSLLREQLRIPYQWWRLTHGILAAVVVIIGLGHTFRVSYYLNEPWKQALWITLIGASVLSIAYVRLVKPWRLGRRPYRVTEVTRVADRQWSLTLVPESGEAIPFRAGQFAAVTIADSPFALDQHPFSIASSARRGDHLEFVVKELGDYTARIGEVKEGARAYVDGAYGSLRLPENPRGPASLMIAGGIGITPIMSMIRTLHDAGSTRRIVLIYANMREEDIAFGEELRRMDADPDFDLEVVHFLAEPPEGWTGEIGFVTEEALERYIPEDDPREGHYVVCGPPPMMEIVERALMERGVPLERIESERFDIGAGGGIGPRQAQVRRLVIALGVVVVIAAAAFASL